MSAWPGKLPKIKNRNIFQQKNIMLELRPNCECCNTDLSPSADARICSFECTFCPDCAENEFKNVCPNCDGNLVVRPIRPEVKLQKYPASSERVKSDHAECQTAK
jgi:hypothetical protein